MANKKTTAKKAAKTAKKTAQKHPKLVIAVVIILVIIIVAIALLWYFKPDLFKNLFGNNDGDNPEAPLSGEEAEIAEAEYSIHFLELGNGDAGDCILIDCGDTEVLIDAGSAQNSAKTLKGYIDKYCTDGKLEYVITTHADQDHIAAYYGSMDGGKRTGILYQYEVGTVIKFARTNKDTQIYKNYMASLELLKEAGTTVYTAEECYYEQGGAKRQYYLDEAQTLSINILYNYYYEHTSSDENNHSVVTLLTKEASDGNKHYLFTGDLEKEGEEKMVEYYSKSSNSKSSYDILPEVELYKGGHHGSKTSSNLVLIDVIKPKNVAVCCCAGSPEYTKNNLNTFPTQEMIDHVGKYTKNIYVTTLATDLPALDDKGEFVEKKWNYTSMNGNIVFYMKGGEFKLYCSNNDTILKETEWFKQYRTWKGVD